MEVKIIATICAAVFSLLSGVILLLIKKVFDFITMKKSVVEKLDELKCSINDLNNNVEDHNNSSKEFFLTGKLHTEFQNKEVDKITGLLGDIRDQLINNNNRK